MSDKVIRFPGAGDDDERKRPEDRKPPADEQASRRGAGGQAEDEAANRLGHLLGLQLSEDQEKALQVVLSGMGFVCVGIRPTGGGADFFTAVHGEEGELRDALPHLQGVIERAYQRKGI